MTRSNETLYGWALSTRLPANSKLLLLAMLNAQLAGSDQHSVDSLAQVLEASPSTARRAISDLLRQGLVRVERRFDDDGRQAENRYIVLHPDA